MILEFKTQEEKDKVIALLNKEGVEYINHSTSFNAFLEHELTQCEDVYGDLFGKDTLKMLRDEVSEDAENIEIDCISSLYYNKVQSYATILDMETIATYVVSNNMAVEVKDLIDDEFTCVVGNEIYIGEVVIDEGDNDCIKIGEMLLPLGDFLRV